LEPAAIVRDTALVIGNTDGIGLALTRQLLDRGTEVIGISKRPSTLVHEAYRHHVLDVSDDRYSERLTEILPGAGLRLCIYCAGIGEWFALQDMALDVLTLQVNLMGLARTASVIVPRLAANGGGVFAGLSSLADLTPSSAAPAYAASKVGMSYYLEGLAAAVARTRVAVVNVRLGFVDTKMAKARRRPWMISADAAARRILRSLTADRPSSRLNVPRRAALIFGMAEPFVRSLSRRKHQSRER
jgi:short-subunit dehydrogenase